MTIKPDHLLLMIAAAVGVVLILKSRQVVQAQGAARQVVGTGSPENVYSGMTLADFERWQSGNRQALQRELSGAGEFWM